jgi:hypothetical protein
MITAPVALLAGFLLRAVQVVVDCSLYLLIGLLTAGALRAMAGPGRIRLLFGAGRWSGPLRAWLAATTLLPVCALGVLPVLRELRRAGVSRGAILTFALAAPMLNPISLVYGVSYLGPRALAILIAGTLLISVGVGVACGYLLPDDATSGAADAGTVPSMGLRRLTAAWVHAAREATGPTLRDVAAGVAGAGLAAALVSPAFLAGAMFAGDGRAIPVMTLIAPPSYLTPDQAVAIVPEMIKFRQSSGAMFLLVALGAGMTLGHVTWIARAYGRRPAAAWLALAVGLAVVVAYGVEALLPPVGTANADNDHFNALANACEYREGIGATAWRFLGRIEPFRWVTSAALLALAVSGLVLRGRGERGTFEAFLSPPGKPDEVPSTTPTPSPWNRQVSPRVASAVALLGLAAIGVAGLYAYFPSPSEAFQDMGIIKADFYGELAATSPAPALHHLDLWDRQVAKLGVGSLIRLVPRGPEASRVTAELREGLRHIRDAIEQGRRYEARVFFNRLHPSYQSCKSAYNVQ